MSFIIQGKQINYILLLLILSLSNPCLSYARNKEKCEQHVVQISKIVIKHLHVGQRLTEVNARFATLDELGEGMSDEQKTEHKSLKQEKLQLDGEKKALFGALEQISFPIKQHCEE